MADKKVNIKITADSQGAEKGLDKVTKKVNSFSKDISKNLSGLTRLTSSIAFTGKAFEVVTGAIGAVSDAIKELGTLYNTQKNAEIQLSTAIKNNPYVDGSAEKRLQSFASAIQNVSTVGDEQLLPMMAQLISTGRTEAETMDIVQAAVDLSASGAMSLESAVSALNATYNGNAGALAKQNGELKNLTAEQLKNGEAVEIIKNKYKGMAEETARATGSAQQLANAWGDLKEELGAPIEAVAAPVRRFFTDIVSGISGALHSLRENIAEARREAEEAAAFRNGTADDETRKRILNGQLEELEKQLAVERQIIEAEHKNGFADSARVIAESGAKIAGYYQQMARIQNELSAMSNADTRRAEEERLEAERKAAEARRSELDQKAAEYKEKNQASLNAALQKIEEERKMQERLGESIDENAYHQSRLNAMTSSYISLIAESDGLITENNQLAKERIKAIEAEAGAMTFTESEYEKLKGIIKEFATVTLDDQKKALEENKRALEALLKTDEVKDDVEKYRQVQSAIEGITEAIRQMGQAETGALDVSDWERFGQDLQKINEKYLSVAGAFIGNFSQTMTTLSNMVQTTARNEADVQLASLEKTFKAGEISEEEYYEKKEQIEREAAKRTYEIQMWQWASQLLQIGASTAQGIVNALATGGPPFVAIPLAATVGALGAAQLAAATASRPTPPSFASGGFVGGMNGASMGQDNTYAHVRTGEAIFNARQQKELWALANGNAGSNGALNVSVKNYRGNDTAVQVQRMDDGLRVTVRRMVTEDLYNRKYNAALMHAEESFNGTTYL